MIFQCKTCRWEGLVPDWSDNTPLEMQRDGSPPKQSVIAVCPQCGGSCKVKVAPCTSI